MTALKKKKLKDFLLLNIGIFLVAVSYSFILDPNHLVMGGVGGIGIILKTTVFSSLSGNLLNAIPSIVIFVLNLVLLILGLIFLGKEFFLKTAYGTLIYPVYTFICENIYHLLMDSFAFEMKGDIFVYVLAGACITGCGLGLAMKSGGSSGGIDVIQVIMLKYFKIPLSIGLLFTDGVIVLVGSLLGGNITMILYGAFFMIISGQIMDGLVFSGINVRACHIISDKHEEIAQKVIDTFERTCTVVDAVGAYSGSGKKLLIVILSNKEYYQLRSIIESIDPSAFVYLTRASEVKGEGFTYEKDQ